LNRAAVFVFFIGDRFFGTITTYVPGPAAAGYAFTSSLPVRILKTMAPTLMPMIEGSEPGEWPIPGAGAIDHPFDFQFFQLTF
jgi:hypothetical protein